MSLAKNLFVFFFTILCLDSFGQSPDSSVQSGLEIYRTDKLLNLPNSFFSKVKTKVSSIEERLNKQTENYLHKLSKDESKLKRKLYKLDSNKTKNLFLFDTRDQYALYIKKIKTDSVRDINKVAGEYLPYSDSLQVLLTFLNENPEILNSKNNTSPNLQLSLDKIKSIQAKMQDADQIKQYITERKDQIKQYLTQFAHLPSGVTKIYSNYNKDLYYYNEQVTAFKESLNDPDKILKEALLILNKLPAFETFMKNNSVLASLFPASPNFGTPLALAGLQTRDQVIQLVQSQFSGANPQQVLMSSISDAQSQLSQLKEKVMAYGNSAADVDMSGFKPDEQKTKPFLRRLEYSVNLQSQHASFYFPKTTDFGISVGYKIKKNIIGIGASYKIAWGNDFGHIDLKNQGVGLRSFMDVKMKGSIYISGGYEYNYQPLLNTQTNELSYWQQSGLIGISKIISMKTKLFKKTKFQLLWDFLSYQQTPKAQPLKFRVGYNF